ncbi:uncharacterized protein WCC33_013515 [Rhinophrynus dorsalis]
MEVLEEVCTDDFEVILFRAAFSLAFFGALHVGELVSLSKNRPGVPVSDFGGHSFRIGAATEAARLGLGPETIRRIGRWESRRFLSYVRPHRVLGL